MNFVQTIFVTIALSGPIAALIGIGIAALCFFRSRKAKNATFAVVSVLSALALLALLATIIVVWFIYGVAHTGKDATTDLVVLSSTVVPAYLGAFAAWRFSVYLKKKLSPDPP
jgi:ABC-type proline/glycine betaine transport system permease subunit